MRFGLFAVALAAAVAAAGLIGPAPASAGDRGYDGYFREPIVDYPLRRAERGCYTRHFDCPDPYAYYYRPRNYYPYYNSGYWRPAYEVPTGRRWYRQPPYGEAWGYGERVYRVYRRRDRGWRHYHHRRHWEPLK
jgi:hypothetical protein